VAGAAEATKQVKILLKDTKFASIKTNVYTETLVVEEIHNVEVWNNSSHPDHVQGLKAVSIVSILCREKNSRNLTAISSTNVQLPAQTNT
jgi:hypothetical protein